VTKKMNYRVARSMFGDYWVGLTDEKVDGKKVFAQLKPAQDAAVRLIEDLDLSDDDRDYAIERIRNPEDEELSVVPPNGRF
jgi:hypothetical protein